MWLFWIWIIQLSVRTNGDDENRGGICRFGGDDGCLYQCLCSRGCDRDTGVCLTNGTCSAGRPKEHPRHGTACLTGNVALGIGASQTGKLDKGATDRVTDGDTATCAQPTAPRDDLGGLARSSIQLETRQHIYDVFVYYGDNDVSDDSVNRKEYWVTRGEGADEKSCRLTETQPIKKMKQFTCDCSSDSINVYRAASMTLCEVVVMATDVSLARGMEACRNQRCADGLACLVDEELFNYHSCVNTQTTLKATNAPQSTPKRPASYDTRNRREVGNIKESTTEPVSTPEPRMRTDNWISLFIVLAFLVMGVALLLIAGLAKIRYMSLRSEKEMPDKKPSVSSQLEEKILSQGNDKKNITWANEEEQRLLDNEQYISLASIESQGDWKTLRDGGNRK